MARGGADIQSWFEGEPRPGQAFAMQRIQEGWDRHDVFVVRAPVGTGKGRLLLAIARWASAKRGGGGLRTFLGVPTNDLLRQILRDAPNFPHLWGSDHYRCEKWGRPCASVAQSKTTGGACRHVSGNLHHPESCRRVSDLRKFRSERRVAAVFHTLLGHRAAGDFDVLLYDEAHNLLRIRQEWAGFSVDLREARVPDNVWTEEELLEWLSTRDARSSPLAGELERVVESVAPGAGRSPTHVLRIVEDERGRRAAATPIDVSSAPPTPYPRKEQKVVLSTATISELDLHQMGLSGRRVMWIDVPSDIPVDRRPIYFDPIVSMTRTNEDSALEDVAEWLEWALREAWPTERGLVHIPYRLGERLYGLCTEKYVRLTERLVWFSPHTRKDVLGRFLQEDVRGEEARGKVLLGAGVSEGLDLRDDRARFQVVVDAPLPSLGDPAMRWLAENAPERYEWEGVRTLSQALGRVSRHPGDFGESVVIDSEAQRLLESPLTPGWVREAIVR